MQINDAVGMSWLVRTIAAFRLRAPPHHLTAHTEPLRQAHEQHTFTIIYRNGFMIDVMTVPQNV